MHTPRILVINPNSNEAVTDGLRASLTEFADEADVTCCTLEDGPFGIESDADIAAVKPLIVDRIGHSLEYDAFVLACYSDPGLTECRERFSKPVFGMQQSALEMASRAGERIGVLALSESSIARHLPYIETLGFGDVLAGGVALDISVDAAASDPGTLDKVIFAGRQLIDAQGADVLVLGCAGMAACRGQAEQVLRVPVIEPTQAAVSLALEAA